MTSTDGDEAVAGANDVSASMKHKGSMISLHDQVPVGESRRLRVYLLAREAQLLAVETSWAKGEMFTEDRDRLVAEMDKRYKHLIREEYRRIDRLKGQASVDDEDGRDSG